MAYEYEIPAVNGKPLVEIPKELKDKVIDYTVLRDKIIIKASDLVDQLLYDTRVKVRDELGRIVRSITEYSYPPTASAIVCKDEDYVYAYRPSNNWKGYILIDKGEAGVEDAKVIQKALDSLTTGRTWKERVVLKGEFVVNKTIYIDSYTYLDLKGAYIKLADYAEYGLIRNRDLTTTELHITIEGGILDGNKNNQSGDTTTDREHWFGILISNPNEAIEDIEILGTKVINCFMNGITIENGYNVFLSNCHVENCGKNGFYLSACKNLQGVNLRAINNGHIYAPDYTARFSGIAIAYHTYHIELTNVYTENNALAGIRVSDENLQDRQCHDIVIQNHISYNDYEGLNVVHYGNGTGYTKGVKWSGRVVAPQQYGALISSAVADWDIEVELHGKIEGTTILNNVKNVLLDLVGYKNSGTATFSGDGSTTQFKIAHGLVSTPDKGKTRVWALSPDAADNFWIDVDDTYIYVNYKTAPPSGTDNIVLGWYAEV